MNARRWASVDSSGSVAWLFRRFGPLIAIAAALVGFKWPTMFDLEAYLAAARALAAGQDPYAATRAAGVAEWGRTQVFVSPPFVAQVLAPFSDLPTGVVFVGWTAAGLLALAVAIRLVGPETLVARAPLVVFSTVYLWGSLFLGQVNLFTLAGLLLALGCRNDRLAGLGLALATVTRAVPAAFALVLLLERRWRALGWAALTLGLVVLLDPGAWLSFVDTVRAASGLPTLDVPVQTSLTPLPALWVLVAAASAAVVGISAVTRRDVTLLSGTAVGLAIVLLPSNAWHHWLSFTLAPLLLYADGSAWSRRALLAFVFASFLTIGWLSSAVAIATLAAMLAVSLRNLRDAWPLVRARGAAILGRP